MYLYDKYQFHISGLDTTAAASMVEKNPLSQRLPGYALALLWGLVSAFGILVMMARKGPRKFFYRKKRNVRPACLDDPTLGVHHYIKLKV